MAFGSGRAGIGSTPQPLLSYEEGKERVGKLSISALLAMAGGFLDGFTYLGYGHVFANSMTGNVVLLGINCFSGSWQTGLRHLPPILAFVLGIWASEALQFFPKMRRVSAPYLGVLLCEIGILYGLLLLPSGTTDGIITASIAFAASVQVQTFREVNGVSYSSTFTTGNLRTLSEAAFAWLWRGHEGKVTRVVRDFSVVCSAFLAGAVMGGYGVRRFGMHALWGEIALLAAVGARVRYSLRSVGAGYERPSSVADG